MTGSRRNIGSLILYLGVLILVFLCGAGLGMVVLSWWLRPPAPAEVSFVTITPAPTSARLLPDGTPCIPLPADWVAYIVQPGDTLSGLANRTGLSQEMIRQVNCLPGSQLLAGQSLYLPPLPTPTPCAISLLPGWEYYTIQSGDTLFSLAMARGTGVEQVIRVNCLQSEQLEAGQPLYLPALPTPTPTQPPPPTSTPVPIVSLPTPAPVATAPIPAPALLAPTPAPTVSVPTVSGPMSTPVVSTPPFPPDTGELVTPVVSPSPTDPNPLGYHPAVLEVAGDPNAPPSPEQELLNGKPCDDFTTPRLLRFRSIVELGARAYFFVCNINPISAAITRSDGLTQQILPLERVPFYRQQALDPPHNPPKAVIEWPALPSYPTGAYTLAVTLPVTVTGSNPLTTTFELTSTLAREHILITPSTGPPGTTFLVYFVNFTSTVTHSFDLYSQDPVALARNPAQSQLYHRARWQVQMSRPLPGSANRGWTVMPLLMPATDPRVTYGIGYNEQIRQPSWLFWLQ